jgi:hypothetical protein
MQQMLHGLALAMMLAITGPAAAQAGGSIPRRTYVVVDTAQRHVFDDRSQLRRAPQPGEEFFGQDGSYDTVSPSYRDHGDGAVTDLNTGLMWQRSPLLSRKLTFAEAQIAAKRARTAGHDDWRLPTIKELYSLIDFNGNSRGREPAPYIDTRFFEFRFGDEAAGERLIDAQYWSSTQYVATTMRGDATVFGVNFADGRIKGYPRDRNRGGEPTKHFVRLVRGNAAYGRNRFVDHRDGTISDLATGLMWMKADAGRAMNWRDALAWCEQLEHAGHADWRLPNAKELQSIVDYSRAPEARDPSQRGPAIDPVFKITDSAAWFWSSTTHLEGPGGGGAAAVYLAFGPATGIMHDRLMDVHGAGAQRSDPKSGDPLDERWSGGMGPQGDVIRILNHVRAVRSIDAGDVKRATPDVSPLPAAKGRERGGAGLGDPFGPPPFGPPPGRRPPRF